MWLFGNEEQPPSPPTTELLSYRLSASEPYSCCRFNRQNNEELARLSNDLSSLYPRKAERVRRDHIRDSINALDAAQQNEAWQAELQRRRIWDRHHQEHQGKANLADTKRKPPQVDEQD